MPRIKITEPELLSTNFGEMVRIPMPTPAHDLMLICAQLNYAKPVRLLLPGQLYYETAQKLLRDHGCRSLSIMPCSSENWIDLDGRPFE